MSRTQACALRVCGAQPPCSVRCAAAFFCLDGFWDAPRPTPASPHPPDVDPTPCPCVHHVGGTVTVVGRVKQQNGSMVHLGACPSPPAPPSTRRRPRTPSHAPVRPRVPAAPAARRSRPYGAEGPCGSDIIIDRSGCQRTFDSAVVEVVGTVGADRTVTEMRSTDFNQDFDLQQYNQMLLLSNGGVRDIF